MTVLVVDDEPIVCNFVTKALEMLGYAVRRARDGQEALNLLQKKPGSVRLLITDLDMPRKNGIELVREVRAIWPEFPIVIMSGYFDRWEDELEGIPCICKPFAISKLRIGIQDALRASVLD